MLVAIDPIVRNALIMSERLFVMAGTTLMVPPQVMYRQMASGTFRGPQARLPARHDGDHLPDHRGRDRDEFPARRDGDRASEWRGRERGRSPDRRDRGRLPGRDCGPDRSRSPDRRTVQAAGSAVDRTIHRHGLPPFVRHHEGVADAEDAIQFACAILHDGAWWSLANLTKQLYGHMPEMRAVLAAPGKTCAATFFESFGFDILAEPKKDVLIRWRGGSAPPRCKWASAAMKACFDLVHAQRGGMLTVTALTGQFYRHPVGQENQLERFFKAPKGMGMKAWLSLTKERRDNFNVFCLDNNPNDPVVRLKGKLKRRSEFIWWVSDRLGEVEGATMLITDLLNEHDRISPISFAMETVGWGGKLADCFSELQQFKVEMRYDAFIGKEAPVITLLASTY